MIVQDDAFAARDSVTICPLTSQTMDLPLFRIPVEPSPTNGLAATSCLMVDNLTTVPRTRLGRRIGILDDALLVRMNRSILVFLGLVELVLEFHRQADGHALPQRRPSTCLHVASLRAPPAAPQVPDP